MNQAMKRALKELPALGCEIATQNRHLVTFNLRGGNQWTCTNRTQMHTVRSVIERQRCLHRVATGEYLSAFPETTSAPRLDVGNYHAPGHFKTRLAQMRGQGVTLADLEAAMFTPDTVRVNPQNGRWIYCAGRIGVVVQPPEHGIYTLVTVLWATDEDWERNPRPEVEKL